MRRRQDHRQERPHGLTRTREGYCTKRRSRHPYPLAEPFCPTDGQQGEGYPTAVLCGCTPISMRNRCCHTTPDTAYHSACAARMAVFLRAGFPGSRGKLALALASHSPHVEASLGRLLVKGSPRLLHTALPARTTSRPAAHEPHHPAADGIDAKLTDAAEETAGRLQEELFRVLCQPRPSSPSLVALVRGIVAAGAAPKLAAVQALADHLTAAKDAKSLKVWGQRCTKEDFLRVAMWVLLCYPQ